MRLLFLPNELDGDPLSGQVGPRAAFAELASQGTITALEIYSFLVRLKQKGAHGALQELLELVVAFEPDVLFWQHVGGFPVDASYLAELRRRAPSMLLAYHEGDAIGRWRKRPPPETRALIAAADLVFAVGLGRQADVMHGYGAREVLHLPHSYDMRFGTDWTPTRTREFDAVMIANLWRGRLPGTYLPGGRKRLALGRRLSVRLGPRFGIFGRGWDRPVNVQAPVPFADQERTLRRAWISVNWEHFDDYAFYFSDRMPITLAAGIPHVAGYVPGYEHIFKGCPGLYFGTTVGDVADCAEWLLSQPRDRLIGEGQEARVWVARHLSAAVVYHRAFEQCHESLLVKRRDARP